MRRTYRANLIHTARSLDSGDPLRRAILSSLRKEALEHSSKEEMQKYLKEHPNADPKNHTVREKSKVVHEIDAPKETKGFLNKLKGVKDSVKKALIEAPEQVQKIFTDPATRKKALGDIAAKAKKDSEKIVAVVRESASKELETVKTAVGAFQKLTRKPPEGWDDEDFKAVKKVTAYAVDAAVAAAGGGPLLAISSVGQSFVQNVALKAIGEMFPKAKRPIEDLLDLAEEAVEVADWLRLASKKKSDKDSPEENLFKQITIAVTKALEKGLSDKDMEDIMRGEKPPKGKQARKPLIRLAYQMEKGSPERRIILKMLRE